MIYDISQRVFGCEVYPDDPRPERKVIKSMEEGELYNLTAFSMCAHNGTHIDAPLHFIDGGKSVDEVPLEQFTGPAFVKECEGDIGADEAHRIILDARTAYAGAEKRILIKGKATVTEEAADVFASAGIFLLGNESQTVGPENAPMAVHLSLLNAGAVLLEGIRLSAVREGAYFLFSAPVNLDGAEGAPCRALLTDITKDGSINCE